jgi:hypothetical protein
MCSDQRHRPALFTLLCCALLSSPQSAADDATGGIKLALTPATCVALQQGRLCYATVYVRWQSATPQDLCLQAGTQKLYCWPTGREGQWRYEFAEYDGQQLQLVSPDGIQAQATISVNWVQKNSRVKRHWRLF